jgi:hypothetical protein
LAFLVVSFLLASPPIILETVTDINMNQSENIRMLVKFSLATFIAAYQ